MNSSSSHDGDDDLEKQKQKQQEEQEEEGKAPKKQRELLINESSNEENLKMVICNGDCSNSSKENESKAEMDQISKKVSLSRNGSNSQEQCRVCQQEKEESLIELGCECRGGVGKAHRSCIDAWFRTKGSNQCEICQVLAVNVTPPIETQPTTNYWVWRIDPNYRQPQEQRERGCFSPLWVAFSILIGGLMLDVLISITLGVSALPVNIIIGVIVVLGIGTALRLTLDFCYEWSLRRAVHRAVQRAESSNNFNFNNNIAYPPAL